MGWSCGLLRSKPTLRPACAVRVGSNPHRDCTKSTDGVGFEPTRTMSTRFPIVRLKPLGHPSRYGRGEFARPSERRTSSLRSPSLHRGGMGSACSPSPTGSGMGSLREPRRGLTGRPLRDEREGRSARTHGPSSLRESGWVRTGRSSDRACPRALPGLDSTEGVGFEPTRCKHQRLSRAPP